MANNAQYQFSAGTEAYVIFDSNGYVIDAKGFDKIMWSPLYNADKNLVGMHVNQLAELIRWNAIDYKAYLDFEAKVHSWLLKNVLQN